MIHLFIIKTNHNIQLNELHSQKEFITNNEHALTIKKDFSTKHYITNVFRSNSDYVEHNVYKKYDIRTFKNTSNISKHFNNYSNAVTNSYKMNKNNVKKACYILNDDITLNKTSNTYSNDTIIKTSSTFYTTDNQYFTKNK